MNQFLLYRYTILFLTPFLKMYLRLRVRWGKEDPARLNERFGIASVARPQGRLFWFHAASVGETQSILPVIETILHYYPDVSVLLTTGTRTSAEMIAPKTHARFIHQYVPIDQPKWVDAFLDYWKPDLALWVESELWPNLIDATARRGTKLILLNAKMSAESFESWKKMKSFSQHVVQPFAMILAQNETYASYFRALGAPMVEVSGNLKFASPPLPCDELEFARLREQLASRKMWLAASTHEPEEMIAGEIHKMLKNTYPQLLTTIAPRHPARADRIRQQFQNAGLQVAQRSRREAIGPATDIYLADTMGELGLLFRLNHIVFMGNSLVAKGGHNLLEPARFGCAIVHGPNMQNFTDLAQQMQTANATAIVQTKEELMGKVDRLLYDAPMREELGRNAQALAQNEDQVLNRVYARLIPFMGTATLPDEVQHARA